jgi:uncharacterized protein
MPPPSFHKDDTEAQNEDYSPPTSGRFRKFANPAPLGLCGFALTTFVLSLINVHARHVTIPNIVIGLGNLTLISWELTKALAYGGLAQFMAGMWEFTTGNTFGAVAFTSYGAFWISFAVIFIPSFNIVAPYLASGVDPAELSAVLGHYLLGNLAVEIPN